MKLKWPKTVAEAVDRLLNELTEENIEKIRHMKKDELFQLHFGLGMWIRNNFGLLQGNKELLRECGQLHLSQAKSPAEEYVLKFHLEHDHVHPDDASGVILDALWRRLQAEKQ